MTRMDASPVVYPPYVAGPLRLEAFHAAWLAPHRVNDPASARIIARSHRDAAARLSRWEATGQLRRDPEPGLFVHEYTVDGVSIRGLVGALDLSHRAATPEEQVVLPHEGVHPAQVADLAERMTRMQLNPAPILLVHHGPAAVREVVRSVVAGTPDRDFLDRADQRHRTWTVRDDDRLTTIAEGLAGSRALVADGHHRYAAYLRMQAQAPGTGADRGLAMLVDQDDTPLHAGAIHRVLSGVTLERLRAAASGVATVHDADRAAALSRLGPHTLVATDGRRWLALDLGDAEGTAVEELHRTLLPRLDPAPRRVGYHHAVDDALAHLPSRRGVALLVPAVDVDAILTAARQGRLVPEKATSFQPKPGLGVLMRSLLAG
jgi:uncharacterized protein (DUF1015 family)